jgi:hypothetical protein
MRRSHPPFLKCVLNPSVRVVVVPKVSVVTEIKDIPEFGGAATGGHLDNAESVGISLMDATEIGTDSVDRGRFLKPNNTGIEKARVVGCVGRVQSQPVGHRIASGRSHLKEQDEKGAVQRNSRLGSGFQGCGRLSREI